MTQIGTVNVGSRVIGLHAFTGEVVDQEKSTYTQTTVHHNNNQVTSRTDTYTELFVRSPDGEERSLQVANMKIGVRRGNTVSLLWGIKAGKEKGDYVAVFNHDTNAVHHIRKGNNDLAGPPGYNMLLIVCAIFIAIGVMNFMGSGFIKVLIGGGGIYWIYLRQKKLMADVAAAARRIEVAQAA